MKPRIDREGMKSLTLKAGRTHKWTVDVTGEPPPTLTWIFKDNEVVNSERIKIENVDYQTNITIINALRKDTGKYTLIAKNASGKDEASLEFTVLGKEVIYKMDRFSDIPVAPVHTLENSKRPHSRLRILDCARNID